jgi:hypothetical protein
MSVAAAERPTAVAAAAAAAGQPAHSVTDVRLEQGPALVRLASVLDGVVPYRAPRGGRRRRRRYPFLPAL